MSSISYIESFGGSNPWNEVDNDYDEENEMRWIYTDRERVIIKNSIVIDFNDVTPFQPEFLLQPLRKIDRPGYTSTGQGYHSSGKTLTKSMVEREGVNISENHFRYKYVMAGNRIMIFQYEINREEFYHDEALKLLHQKYGESELQSAGHFNLVGKVSVAQPVYYKGYSEDNPRGAFEPVLYSEVRGTFFDGSGTYHQSRDAKIKENEFRENTLKEMVGSWADVKLIGEK